MEPSLDPRKHPHLRPQLNPFSIFGNEAVPDIFDEDALSRGVGRAKNAMPAVVPAMDDAFSLLPPEATHKKSQPERKQPHVVAAVPVVPVSTVVAAPVGAAGGGDDDDSFFDDEEPDKQATAELEHKLAQREAEVAQSRMQIAQLQQGLAEERAAKRMLEEEVRQLNVLLAQQKKKEMHENKALEAALSAIEAKLQAANARAKEAEAEAASLRLRVSSAAEGDDLEACKKKLGRAARTAANLSLEFGDATAKSAEAFKEMYTTMTKLTALLASFEKVVAE